VAFQIDLAVPYAAPPPAHHHATVARGAFHRAALGGDAEGLRIFEILHRRFQKVLFEQDVRFEEAQDTLASGLDAFVAGRGESAVCIASNGPNLREFLPYGEAVVCGGVIDYDQLGGAGVALADIDHRRQVALQEVVSS
jgi:hypothetical protein